MSLNPAPLSIQPTPIAAAKAPAPGRVQAVTAPDHAPPIAILDIPLDPITIQEAIARVETMIASRRPHYLVTANVDFLVQAQHDLELHRILFDAHLVLCDGTPLVWASRWLGNSLPERVAGADLVPLLIELAERKGYRLFFLGATPASAQRAVEKITARYPRLTIAGQYSPPFSKLLEMDHDEVKRRIREANPDMLFVSFGCPKQEKWMAMHYQSLGVPVSIGVGATIDFLAGEVKRAPLWMQRGGLEWIFRLAQEPRRLFRRYLKDLWVFGRQLLVQSWHLRRPIRLRHNPVSLPRSQSEPGQPVQIPARLDMELVRNESACFEAMLQGNHDAFLILDQVQFVDSTGMGMLIQLQKRLRQAGRQLVLVAPSEAVKRALALMHLDSFFTLAPDLETARNLLENRAREACASSADGAAQPRLEWHGEITAANISEVWTSTCRHFEAQAGVSEWCIDLGQVRFLDSSGLGLMLRIQKQAQRQGCRVRFTGIPPCVHNVVQLARLEKVLLQ